jgi:hypothetical protein
MPFPYPVIDIGIGCYRNGNEVLIAKGETIACPFSMFIRYVELSGTNLDSDFYIFRPIFRTVALPATMPFPYPVIDIGIGCCCRSTRSHRVQTEF